jgi:enterochelin esterase-like enzyme
VLAGETVAYRVYLPPCYGEDGRVYPTLTMLGGNVHDDGVWDALGLDEAAEAGIRAGTLPPLILVMPDGGWFANNTSGGPASYEGLILSELLPHIEQTYCAWPAREGRAIGGLSRGGYWSLEIAFRHPGVFRSVGAHSPALIDSFAGPDVDPVFTGVANDLGDLRILVDIGARDPYLVDARPLYEALTADGVAVDWRVAEGGRHDEAYWRERVEPYLSWYSDGWRVERAALPACGEG